MRCYQWKFISPNLIVRSAFVRCQPIVCLIRTPKFVWERKKFVWEIHLSSAVKSISVCVDRQTTKLICQIDELSFFWSSVEVSNVCFCIVQWTPKITAHRHHRTLFIQKLRKCYQRTHEPRPQTPLNLNYLPWKYEISIEFTWIFGLIFLNLCFEYICKYLSYFVCDMIVIGSRSNYDRKYIRLWPPLWFSSIKTYSGRKKIQFHFQPKMCLWYLIKDSFYVFSNESPVHSMKKWTILLILVCQLFMAFTVIERVHNCFLARALVVCLMLSYHRP